jgi:hypothetical protein
MHAVAIVSAIVLLVLAAAALAWWFPPVRLAHYRSRIRSASTGWGHPAVAHTPALHATHFAPVHAMPHLFVHPLLPHHDSRNTAPLRERVDRRQAYAPPAPARESVGQQRYYHRPRPERSFAVDRDSDTNMHYARATPAVAKHA